MKFNEKLQKLRKDNNFSQEELANKLNVSRQSVSKWESASSYPEMDKLLTLAKLFNITLEQLTNDEISIENVKDNNQSLNFALSFIKDLVDDTIKLANNMTYNKFIKFIIDIFIILIIIAILKIPFDIISSLGRVFVNSLGSTVGVQLKNMWEFLINIIYTLGSLLLFGYVYKEHILNKYLNKKEVTILKDKEVKDEAENIEEQQTYIYYKSDSLVKNLFTTLTKGFLTIFIVPFIFSLLGLIIIFGILISGMLYKVFYFGFILLVFSFIIMNVLFLEVLIKVLLDEKQNLKRVFLSFLFSLLILTVGTTISFVELSNTNFDASIKEVYKFTTKEEIINMNEYLEMRFMHNVDFVEDNTLNNKVKIEYSYIDKVVDANINVLNNELIDFTIKTQNRDNEVIKLLVNGLKNKKIYNDMNSLYDLRIVVTTSKENISIIKDNTFKYESDDDDDDDYNYLEDEIEDLHDLNEKLQEENDELKDKLNELKDLLQ